VIQAPTNKGGGVVSDRAVVHWSGVSGIVGQLRPIGHRAESDDPGHQQNNGQSQQGSREEEQAGLNGEGRENLGGDRRISA